MTINRNNYESYFLLYVDNELSATDRIALDEFVQQNPDLQKELLMLMQTVMPGDRVSFDNKASLIKEIEVVTIPEKLLLYADGELPYPELKEMEGLLLTDEVLAREWEILRQTKIQPDHSIGFGDKFVLYRNTRGRLVGIKWWRVAMAAIFLGFGIWGGLVIYKNNLHQPKEDVTIARTKLNQQPKNKSNTNLQSADLKNPASVKQITPEIVSTNRSPLNPEEKAIKKKDWFVEKRNLHHTIPEKQNITITNKNDPHKQSPGNLPVPLEKNNNSNSNINSIVNVSPLAIEKITPSNKNFVATINTEKQPQEIKKIPENKTIEPTNSYAKNAVYNAAEEEKDDTHILYMNEEKVKRTVIGGLFRKLKRVVERKTGVNTGNIIKVAGFEIAIK